MLGSLMMHSNRLLLQNVEELKVSTSSRVKVRSSNLESKNGTTCISTYLTYICVNNGLMFGSLIPIPTDCCAEWCENWSKESTMRTTNGSGRFEDGGGRGRGRGRGSWRGRGRGRGRSGGDGNDSLHKKGNSKAKTWRLNDDALESRFGYQNFTEGEPRLGWLLNMVSVSWVLISSFC